MNVLQKGQESEVRGRESGIVFRRPSGQSRVPLTRRTGSHLVAPLSCLAILLALFAFVRPARAEFFIEPARQEVTMPPGDTQEGEYTIRNTGAEPKNIGVRFRDWFVLPENKFAAKDWLTIAPTGFVLDPGQEQKLKFLVHLPSSAVGTCVAMISFAPESEGGVSTLMSVSLYVTAMGTEKVSWDVQDMLFKQTPQGLEFSGQVKNNGNVHVRPHGTVTVHAGRGKNYSLTIPEMRPAYPGTDRFVTAKQDGVKLEPGKYKVTVKMVSGTNEIEIKKKLRVHKNGVLVLQ